MAIELNGVTKRYGVQPVMEHFDLRIPDAAVTCLYGPSGCGKTTLLRLIADLERPDAGRVTGTKGRKTAFVFQEPRLLPWLTAEQNIDAVLPEPQKGAAASWIAEIGLQGAGGKYPAQLSGGMRQRVSIARALAYSGDILLLDEPFQGLDPATRATMMDLIARNAGPRPVVLVTHSMEEARAMASEICILSGPPLQIVERLTNMPGRL